MPATAHVAPFALAATALLAQSTPPPIPVELRARFGFEGPLVVKIGDGISDLRIADVDGDGRPEVVALDARRARLVAVTVKGKDTSLQSIPTNGQIAGYAIADVDGDARPELCLVDARGRLTVRKPGAEPEDPPIDLGLASRGLLLLPGDLDGDGKSDLVAIGKGSMRWITRLGAAAKAAAIEPFDDNAHSFHLADLDGDGKLDLLAVVPGTNMGLRLRSGDGTGGFGPWRIFAVDDLCDVFPARAADGKQALATIAGNPRRVALQQLATADDGQALDWWSFGESASAKCPPWALGDLDGDGDQDLVVARPDRAQLLVFEWRDQTFVQRTVPTLAGIAAVTIGDVDKDGKNDIVLVSPEEDAVAWIAGSGPIDRFPVQLPTVDKPITAAVDPAGGVVVLGRNDKRDAHLHRIAPGQERTRLASLGRLPADPVRLFLGDVGDAAGLECAFVVPGEGLRTVTLDGGKAAKDEAAGDAKKPAKAAEVAGFTKKLDDGAIAIGAHDGAPALFAVRERFARTFRVDDQGQVRVLAQDNGPDGLAELSLAAEVPGGRLWFDRKAAKLVRTTANQPPLAVEVPNFDFQHLAAHQGGALLIGARGVLRVPFARGAALQAITTHESPTDRTFYWSGCTGDFDHDGIADLAIVDRHLPGVQILAGGKNGLQRALAVPVYETRPSGEPEAEPRELVAGDLDGDGRTDFVLIAHDRILIYLQEP